MRKSITPTSPIAIIIIMLFGILLFGCAAQPSAPTAHNPFEGYIKFNATLPATANITYVDRNGQTLVAESSYPGFIYVIVDLSTPLASVNRSIAANDGEIVSAIPLAGIYVAQVAPGTESAFLSAMYKETWFLDGIPAFPLAPAAVTVYDMFSSNPAPADCLNDHGNFVSNVAKRLASSTDEIDVRSANPYEIAADMTARMEIAKEKGQNQVFSLSLQPKGMATGVPPEDRTGCVTLYCNYARQSEKVMFRIYLHTLQNLINNDPTAAERAVIVISAGNVGVDLDREMAKLRGEYPDAFRRVKVVGGTINPNMVEPILNHLQDNSIKDGTSPNMIYARGIDVDVGWNKLCSGTSFAAPEVSGVIDYIWSKAPSLNASQVIDAFDQAMREQAKNGVVPQDREGRTLQSFLDRAVAIAQSKLPAGTGQQVTQPNQATVVAEKELVIQIPKHMPNAEISYRRKGLALVQNDYEYWFNVSGGYPPYEYASVTGLPPGLNVSPVIGSAADWHNYGVDAPGGTNNHLGRIEGAVEDNVEQKDYPVSICIRDHSATPIISCVNTSLSLGNGCPTDLDGGWKGKIKYKFEYTTKEMYESYSPPSIADKSYDFSFSLDCIAAQANGARAVFDIVDVTSSMPALGCTSGCKLAEGEYIGPKFKNMVHYSGGDLMLPIAFPNGYEVSASHFEHYGEGEDQELRGYIQFEKPNDERQFPDCVDYLGGGVTLVGCYSEPDWAQNVTFVPSD